MGGQQDQEDRRDGLRQVLFPAVGDEPLVRSEQGPGRRPHRLGQDGEARARGHRGLQGKGALGQGLREAGQPGHVEELAALLAADVAAEFSQLPPSQRKRLAGFYFEAKQEETKKRRLEKIQRAITTKDKGMLY
ncbi:MAG: YdeI/OmpD-associated family protein [Candidatus Competibacteraceae bacterium]|nr:YdeI/OmpD-associated family protein [Candidatus Competibacteraceae bacterium]